MEESGHALPRTARHLIAHVYERYMRDGVLPEVEEFFVVRRARESNRAVAIAQ